jgi:hypothetical protein
MATQVALHRADLTTLTGLASTGLVTAMRGVPEGDAAGFRDALQVTLDDLVALFAPAAASLGADWYDELREEAEVRGRFQAIVADLPDAGRTQALAGWAVEPLFGATPDVAAVLTRADGGLQRIILDADRNTIARSAVADPQALGWQRVGSGACAFCRMLIGRGAVYSEATVQFASHDNCRCSAVPAFGGQPLPVKPYTPTSRNITEADRARVREYLRNHPEL